LSVVPVAAFALVAAAVLVSNVNWWREDAVPLTLQEWVWAAKDGYLDTMFSHYFHNGGL
jgi:hypothetical protein